MLLFGMIILNNDIKLYIGIPVKSLLHASSTCGSGKGRELESDKMIEYIKTEYSWFRVADLLYDYFLELCAR